MDTTYLWQGDEFGLPSNDDCDVRLCRAGTRVGQWTAVGVTLLKALSRAIYWQQPLHTGRVGSVADITAAGGMDRVMVHKSLKLARLAPDIAQDIARRREPVGLSQEFFIRRELPDEWNGLWRVFSGLRV